MTMANYNGDTESSPDVHIPYEEKLVFSLCTWASTLGLTPKNKNPNGATKGSKPFVSLFKVGQAVVLTPRDPNAEDPINIVDGGVELCPKCSSSVLDKFKGFVEEYCPHQQTSVEVVPSGSRKHNAEAKPVVSLHRIDDLVQAVNDTVSLKDLPGIAGGLRCSCPAMSRKDKSPNESTTSSSMTRHCRRKSLLKTHPLYGAAGIPRIGVYNGLPYGGNKVKARNCDDEQRTNNSSSTQKGDLGTLVNGAIDKYDDNSDTDEYYEADKEHATSEQPENRPRNPRKSPPKHCMKSTPQTKGKTVRCATSTSQNIATEKSVQEVANHSDSTDGNYGDSGLDENYELAAGNHSHRKMLNTKHLDNICESDDTIICGTESGGESDSNKKETHRKKNRLKKDRYSSIKNSGGRKSTTREVKVECCRKTKQVTRNETDSSSEESEDESDSGMEQYSRSRRAKTNRARRNFLSSRLQVNGSMRRSKRKMAKKIVSYFTDDSIITCTSSSSESNESDKITDKECLVQRRRSDWTKSKTSSSTIREERASIQRNDPNTKTHKFNLNSKDTLRQRQISRRKDGNTVVTCDADNDASSDATIIDNVSETEVVPLPNVQKSENISPSNSKRQDGKTDGFDSVKNEGMVKTPARKDIPSKQALSSNGPANSKYGSEDMESTELQGCASLSGKRKMSEIKRRKGVEYIGEEDGHQDESSDATIIDSDIDDKADEQPKPSVYEQSNQHLGNNTISEVKDETDVDNHGRTGDSDQETIILSDEESMEKNTSQEEKEINNVVNYSRNQRTNGTLNDALSKSRSSRKEGETQEMDQAIELAQDAEPRSVQQMHTCENIPVSPSRRSTRQATKLEKVEGLPKKDNAVTSGQSPRCKRARLQAKQTPMSSTDQPVDSEQIKEREKMSSRLKCNNVSEDIAEQCNLETKDSTTSKTKQTVQLRRYHNTKKHLQHRVVRSELNTLPGKSITGDSKSGSLNKKSKPFALNVNEPVQHIKTSRSRTRLLRKNVEAHKSFEKQTGNTKSQLQSLKCKSVKRSLRTCRTRNSSKVSVGEASKKDGLNMVVVAEIHAVPARSKRQHKHSVIDQCRQSKRKRDKFEGSVTVDLPETGQLDIVTNDGTAMTHMPDDAFQESLEKISQERTEPDNKRIYESDGKLTGTCSDRLMENCNSSTDPQRSQTRERSEVVQHSGNLVETYPNDSVLDEDVTKPIGKGTAKRLLRSRKKCPVQSEEEPCSTMSSKIPHKTNVASGVSSQAAGNAMENTNESSEITERDVNDEHSLNHHCTLEDTVEVHTSSGKCDRRENISSEMAPEQAKECTSGDSKHCHLQHSEACLITLSDSDEDFYIGKQPGMALSKSTRINCKDKRHGLLLDTVVQEPATNNMSSKSNIAKADGIQKDGPMWSSAANLEEEDTSILDGPVGHRNIGNDKVVQENSELELCGGVDFVGVPNLTEVCLAGIESWDAVQGKPSPQMSDGVGSSAGNTDSMEPPADEALSLRRSKRHVHKGPKGHDEDVTNSKDRCRSEGEHQAGILLPSGTKTHDKVLSVENDAKRQSSRRKSQAPKRICRSSDPNTHVIQCRVIGTVESLNECQDIVGTI